MAERRGPLDPAHVAVRLSVLRALYIPEPLDQARDRLAKEQPRPSASFEQVAARSLGELRALCELARALHATAPRH